MSLDFPELKNDCLIKTAFRQNVPGDRRPIWIMRQAGRYLPEFRELRQKHSFFEICETPELACEVTLMPIKRYDLDAAIIFSDILVVPKALGMDVKMEPGIGPVLPNPIRPDTIEQLNINGALQRLQYVGEAISLTVRKLNGSVPLFGFSGAPWTLMAYMIEGGGSKTCSKAKRWLYEHPAAAHRLLSILTSLIIDYVIMQIDHGAQIIQIFDSSAEFLDSTLYKSFSIPYLKQICRTVQKNLQVRRILNIPLVIFAKGAYHSLQDLGSCGYQVVGIDWTVPMDLINSELTEQNVAVQGNLDPCALYAPKDALVQHIKGMLDAFSGFNHIVNLGHGIYPDTDPNAVKTFIDVVRNYTG